LRLRLSEGVVHVSTASNAGERINAGDGSSLA
jgi:hypothetical protein